MLDLIKNQKLRRGVESTLSISPFLAIAIAATLFASFVLIDISYYARYSGIMWPEKDFITGCITAIILGGIVVALPVKEKSLLIIYWGIKVAVMLCAMLFYEGKYPTLDAWVYIHSDPNADYMAGHIGGTRLIAFISDFLMNLTGGSYHSVKLVFGFAGMWGVYLMCRASEFIFGKQELKVYLLIALFPSVLFWSSILGKEPLTLLGVGVFFYGVARFIRLEEKRTGSAVIIALGIIISMLIRKWYIVFLLPAALVALWRKIGTISKLAIVFILVVTLTGAVTKRAAKGAFYDEMVEEVESINEAFSGGGSTQKELDITSPVDLIKEVPKGAFTAVFRPLPFDIRNAFSLIAAMENTALLFFAFLAIRRFRWECMKNPMFVSLFVYAIIWSMVYAIPSSRNLGSAVRYKLGLLPVLLLLLWGLLHNNFIGSKRNSNSTGQID